jgi:phosphoserine aminotransferase
MTKRAYNFNAGPAALPLEVLQQAQEEFVDFKGIGMSIMEVSHRSKEYEAVHNETSELVLEHLGLTSGYKVLFLQGGATTQFAMIPMNFLKQGQVGAYVDTGSWADKAIAEARLFGDVAIAAKGQEAPEIAIPKLSEIEIPANASYLHITSNETIAGSQWQQFPETGDVPLIADMSSDILSRSFDASKFSLIYAGAQKNLGPSGVTLVVVKDDFVGESPKSLPVMLRYNTYTKNNSLYNTPPVYSIYMVNLVLKWLKSKGGVSAMEKINREKTSLIYNAIDNSGGFYSPVVAKDSRSIMNVTWRMANEDLEKQFVKESQAAGFIGLGGHRSVGGLRASTYNAVPYESCKALVEFMDDFKRRNG